MEAPFRNNVRCLPIGTTKIRDGVEYKVAGYQLDHNYGGMTEVWERITPLSATEKLLKQLFDTHTKSIEGVDAPYTLDEGHNFNN